MPGRGSGARFAGERIPTLEEILEFSKKMMWCLPGDEAVRLRGAGSTRWWARCANRERYHGRW